MYGSNAASLGDASDQCHLRAFFFSPKTCQDISQDNYDTATPQPPHGTSCSQDKHRWLGPYECCQRVCCWKRRQAANVWRLSVKLSNLHCLQTSCSITVYYFIVTLANGYYLGSDGSRFNLRACKFQNFSGGACPQTPIDKCALHTNHLQP